MAETSHIGDVSAPLYGLIINLALSLSAVSVLSHFLTKRTAAIKVWRRLPFVSWLVFAIYIDSYLFVASTALLQHSFGVNSSLSVCWGAITLCLGFYVTTKLIYLFLVEKAHIIRGSSKRRLQSRLYLFNSFGMLSVYTVIVVVNFVLFEGGQCIIGMQKKAMIPLISFDLVVNVYLTSMFLIPLKNLHSFKNMPQTSANIRLRSVAVRTFVGSVCTLVSSIVNLTVLMLLNGEPSWICLMCCNADVLFSAIVLQWVTSQDNASTSIASSSNCNDLRNIRPEMCGSRIGNSRGTISHSFSPRHYELSPSSTPANVYNTTSARLSEVDDDDGLDGSSIGKLAQADSKSVLVTTIIQQGSVPMRHDHDGTFKDFFGGPGSDAHYTCQR